jgi:hypothetical protein
MLATQELNAAAQARAEAAAARNEELRMQREENASARALQAQQFNVQQEQARKMLEAQIAAQNRPYDEQTAAQRATLDLQSKGDQNIKISRRAGTLNKIGENLDNLSQLNLPAPLAGQQAATFLNAGLADPEDATAVGSVLFPDIGGIDKVNFVASPDGRITPRISSGGKVFALDANENLVPYDKAQLGTYRAYTPQEINTHLKGIASVLTPSQDYTAAHARGAAEGAAVAGAGDLLKIKAEQDMLTGIRQGQEVESEAAKKKAAERENAIAESTRTATQTALQPYTPALQASNSGLSAALGTQALTKKMFNITPSMVEKTGKAPAVIASQKLEADLSGAVDKHAQILVDAGILPQADITSLPPAQRNQALTKLAAGILALRELDPAAVDDGLSITEIQQMRDLLNKQPIDTLTPKPAYADTGLGLGRAMSNAKDYLKDNL